MASNAVHKPKLSRLGRILRLIVSVVDPRAWAHGLKLLNYYNYSHVQELRAVKLGRDVRISPTAVFANGRNIEIGDRAHIGAHAHIWAGPGLGRILIGADALFGPNVMLTAANYRFNEGAPVTKQAMAEADIHLGRDVWLGYGVVVLPGARIGDGVVVAANSVVRGEIPAFSVVAGAPAKVVASRSRPDAG